MTVRILKEEDLRFAVALTEEEGWFYTARELEVMLRLDPEGSFVFEEDELLGFVTCVTYGRTGVLGHLIVSRKGRGRRIGSTLVGMAVEYMESRGAESMLVLATERAVRLYEKFGFRIQDHVICMHSMFEKNDGHSRPEMCVRISDTDIAKVIETDRELFGDDRGRLINEIYREGPEHCFKLERDGRLVGYVFGRPDHIGYNLGPWVCLTENEGDARLLMDAALSTFESGKICTGSFATNKAALKIMKDLPRINEWRIPLMIRGARRYRGSTQKFFGIAAFELG